MNPYNLLTSKELRRLVRLIGERRRVGGIRGELEGVLIFKRRESVYRMDKTGKIGEITYG